jgi:hypothetical protein
VKSRLPKREDARQSAFDLDAPAFSEIGDPVERMARCFAARLIDVKCIRATGEASHDDARSVNAHIAMVATEADALITALIKDAEANGLDSAGRWMNIPLVECQEFEVVTRDPAADEVDDIHDLKLNS